MLGTILAKLVTTAMIIASPMFQAQVANMDSYSNIHNFKATVWGQYIEMMNVTYDPTIDMSFATSVRYNQEASGKDQAYVYFEQVRHLSGKKTAQDFLDDQEVLSYVTKL